MAFWRIDVRNNRIALRCRRRVLADEDPEPCGDGPASFETEVEAFVMETAAPWDLILTSRGILFARLSEPVDGFFQS